MKTVSLYRCCGAGWKYHIEINGRVHSGNTHYKRKLQAWWIALTYIKDGETYLYRENGKEKGECIK